jgi:hypothetical protein
MKPDGDYTVDHKTSKPGDLVVVAGKVAGINAINHYGSKVQIGRGWVSVRVVRALTAREQRAYDNHCFKRAVKETKEVNRIMRRLERALDVAPSTLSVRRPTR